MRVSRVFHFLKGWGRWRGFADAGLAADIADRVPLRRGAARGELRPDSYIDLLVEFDRPVSLFEFARLRGHLQDLEELDYSAETDTLLELDLPTWMRELSRSRSAG